MEHLLQMRQFFNSGKTKPYTFRKTQLTKLRDAVIKFEEQIHQALYTDLKKNPEECWVTETGFLIAELNNAIKHLKAWMQPETVQTNLLNAPSKSFILQEPMGVVLIISPWNYPFQLLLTPLAGAMAAGNCIVLKSSEFAPATSTIMKKMIEENFEKDYIRFEEGDGATVIPALLNNFTFDHIFYTGSTAVGKIIYKMAAEKLTPVTLELGGKNPCIVETDANIKVAARRIAMTKFSNAGQMCVAPDYILVHESKKTALVEALKKVILQFFSDKPDESYNYGKIINEKQFNRLTRYLQQGNIIYGGRTDKEKLFIEPTIIDNVDLEMDIMNDEIFGPILPILTFITKDEALKVIAKNMNPLAFYVFTSNRAKETSWLNSVAFGGGCVNNASWHLTNHHLPFGGRG
ncbi:MAG TPA: aldehyde dehydrogenase family protein, partial [Ferruginibacter sp.]|nr:aldehyde dehydrogenase family protein [Ferruginibacter sp.]